MESKIETRLEQLLAASILERSIAIRSAWRAEHACDVERGAPENKEPSADVFIDQAVDEVNHFRKYIISKLSE